MFVYASLQKRTGKREVQERLHAQNGNKTHTGKKTMCSKSYFKREVV